MHTGSLHKFHNTGDKYVLAVADGIHLNLFAANVLIHQNRLILVNFYGSLQVVTKCFFLGDDLHSSATEHKAGTDKHGIANFFSCLNAGFDTGYCLTLRLRNVQGNEQFFKGITVFRTLNSITVGADDFHSTVSERFCQIDSSLTAQGCNNTLRLFHLDDVHNIFHAQRLKIKLVGTGVVGGNGFRVIVDDNCFITRCLNSLHRMNGGVVKLYALTDADRPGAEHDNLLFIRNNRLVFILISGIEIWNIAFKFGSAGIDHFINRNNTVCFS